MFDYDAVIIGGGPAGLTAGLYLSRSGHRTLLLEKEGYGGPIKNVEWIENYPGFAEGVSGAQLASDMVTQATRYGLHLEDAEVTGVELFSSCRWVTCADGKGFTCSVIILAGGALRRKLGVPGEEALYGKGVFDCALCEGGKFADRVVVVCGGGDAGLTEALYLSKIASKVVVVELESKLTATAVLRERAAADPKIEIHCGLKVEAVAGQGRVEGVEYTERASGRKGVFQADGVLVYVGLEPNTAYIRDIVPLDSLGQVIVNSGMETEIPYILAAGDIRAASPRQIATAVGDGATAAVTAQKLLQQLTEA